MIKKLFIGTLLIVGISCFVPKGKIPSCFLSFRGAGILTAQRPDRLPDSAEKFREVQTNKGVESVTRVDGYRILYSNAKGAPFVNLKVELSDVKSYQTDTTKLIENLKYMNGGSDGMATKDIIELSSNGYKVYGLSRGSIENAKTLGIFIMFPSNNIVVYFYFNNMPAHIRNFESVKDYESQRDNFINEYTKFLNSCKKSR